ncbi:uncharacterized protein LOC127421242 [Myxocyprinus asiaticus]|uniref:uncharacterized protein LOC127421242 n=1 Tax=Myxocyprinus asiaticus TaxID=70543 RepID=UPI0022214D5F|nr:uncharacterized protein LOC127421242 [Myxocyprinus asiaticus]
MWQFESERAIPLNPVTLVPIPGKPQASAGGRRSCYRPPGRGGKAAVRKGRRGSLPATWSGRAAARGGGVPYRPPKCGGFGGTAAVREGRRGSLLATWSGRAAARGGGVPYQPPKRGGAFHPPGVVGLAPVRPGSSGCCPLEGGGLIEDQATACLGTGESRKAGSGRASHGEG